MKISPITHRRVSRSLKTKLEIQRSIELYSESFSDRNDLSQLSNLKQYHVQLNRREPDGRELYPKRCTARTDGIERSDERRASTAIVFSQDIRVLYYFIFLPPFPLLLRPNPPRKRQISKTRPVRTRNVRPTRRAQHTPIFMIRRSRNSIRLE